MTVRWPVRISMEGRGRGRGRCPAGQMIPAGGTICNQDWVGFLPSFSCITPHHTTDLWK